MEDPTLIQRLKEAYNKDMPGVDGVVTCDYMGSAEFEFGAIPNALRTMRNHKNTLVRKQLTTDSHKVWFVGKPDALGQAQKWFALALIERDHSHDPTYLAHVYKTSPCEMLHTLGDRIVGWWALDAHPVPWALFTEAKTAAAWLERIQRGKPKKAE